MVSYRSGFLKRQIINQDFLTADHKRGSKIHIKPSGKNHYEKNVPNLLYEIVFFSGILL